MMKKKVIALAMAVLMLGTLALTGCKKEAPIGGDKVAEVIFNLMLKNDATSAVELFGFASEEEARKGLGMEDNIYEDLADQLATQFSSAGMTVSNEQMQAFVDAFITMFSNVELTAVMKEADEKAGTAVVTCTVNTFDPEALTQGMAEAMNNVDPSVIESGDMEAAFGSILQAMADVIADIKPTDKTADFDVDFVLRKMDVNGKEKLIWMPEDEAKFGELISSTAMGG